MNIVRHVTAAVAAVLLFVPTLHADPVTATIVDNLGVPVAGAEVEVSGVGGPPTTTDAAGFFVLNLPTGTYDLQISPPSGVALAPIILRGVLVNGSASLGTLAFPIGVLLSGTVVGPAGTPVVNGDLDVFDELTGIKLSTPNDKTSATGTFSLRVPTATLRLRAEPASGQVLVSVQQTLVVSNALNTGTITLPPGNILSGTVVSSASGLPLAGVDIDVDQISTNQRIPTPSDDTDATGAFSVIVPAGLHTVSFESPDGGSFVGRRVIGVAVNGTTSMGTVSLDPGLEISGTLVDNNAFPVAGADLDVKAEAGDTTIYTPNDATGPDGSFRVIIPSGSHRIIYQPEKSTGLVAFSTAFTNFTTSTNLGNVICQPGQTVSGLVTAFNGVPQSDCRVIVRDTSTGDLIETTDNATDTSGSYSVIVPAGTYDFHFRTRKASLARDTTTTGVTVAGPTTVNAALTLLPMLVYVDDPAFPGPQVVLPGSPQLFITVVIYNPNGITTGAFLHAEVEDPFGNKISLLMNSPTVLGATQYIFAQFLPVPLPSVNPAYVNLPHTFRLILTDPIDSSEVDLDEFTYFPQ